MNCYFLSVLCCKAHFPQWDKRETYKVDAMPCCAFTLELSRVVGVASGSSGLWETREQNGSYRWKRERMTRTRRQRILATLPGCRRSGRRASRL